MDNLRKNKSKHTITVGDVLPVEIGVGNPVAVSTGKLSFCAAAGKLGSVQTFHRAVSENPIVTNLCDRTWVPTSDCIVFSSSLAFSGKWSTVCLRTDSDFPWNRRDTRTGWERRRFLRSGRRAGKLLLSRKNETLRTQNGYLYINTLAGRQRRPISALYFPVATFASEIHGVFSVRKLVVCLACRLAAAAAICRQVKINRNQNQTKKYLPVLHVILEKAGTLGRL